MGVVGVGGKSEPGAKSAVDEGRIGGRKVLKPPKEEMVNGI